MERAALSRARSTRSAENAAAFGNVGHDGARETRRDQRNESRLLRAFVYRQNGLRKIRDGHNTLPHCNAVLFRFRPAHSHRVPRQILSRRNDVGRFFAAALLSDRAGL